MSIYIVQGWGGVLGCGRGPVPRRSSHPTSPSPLRPGFARPARGLHLRFSLFAPERDETTKTRENNKTLQCEVNGAVRSVGRAGQGRSKRVRRDWRREPKVGRPGLGGSCSPGATARPGQLAELRGREAPSRREPLALPVRAASQAGGRAPSAGRLLPSAAPALGPPQRLNATRLQSLWVGGTGKMGAPCSLSPFRGAAWPRSPKYCGS